MVKRLLGCLLLAAMFAVVTAHAGAAGRENTPGYRFYQAGDEAFRAGHFRNALHNYIAAARWADKLAQFNIGLQHARGQGTPVDPPRAWAWLALSAERGYPMFVEGAGQVWDALTDDQRAAGRIILESELMPEFGDAVTVARAARRMASQRRNVTGSRTGSIGTLMVSNVDQWIPMPGGALAMGTTQDAVQHYRRVEWDFIAVIEQEAQMFDRIGRGRVIIRELEILNDN